MLVVGLEMEEDMVVVEEEVGGAKIEEKEAGEDVVEDEVEGEMSRLSK